MKEVCTQHWLAENSHSRRFLTAENTSSTLKFNTDRPTADIHDIHLIRFPKLNAVRTRMACIPMIATTDFISRQCYVYVSTVPNIRGGFRFLENSGVRQNLKSE